MNAKIILLFCVMFIYSSSSAQITESSFKVSYGRLLHIENFQSKFIQPRNVEIWLPDGYNDNEKYPVLYMHDGQMLFDSTATWNKQEWGADEVIGKLIEENKIRTPIVVGIWNTKDRHSEYFPQKPFEKLPEAYRDSLLHKAERSEGTPLFTNSIQSDNYLKFIVGELKPFIDNYFYTLRDVQNTFIAGSSMGGLISMYAICEYPDIFGGAACMSTHWTGTFTDKNNPIPSKFVEYLEENLPDPSTHKIYFDYGTETLDALYKPFQSQVDSVMNTKGFTKDNWITLKFEGENHSEISWHKRLNFPLTFLLGYEKI